jgi:predicted DNA repair protein MutK
MALGSLLALLDDIATVLDDVSVMTKVAVKKTAGVLGDDLAVNAEKVLGVRPERELAVVWAVAKGSFKNKLILVPAAMLISLFVPWLITPLLVCGGLYLCFEGAEKVLHYSTKAHSEAELEEVADRLSGSYEDLVAFEREKINGAIRTDFILSAEIIVLTLGVVEAEELLTQLLVLSGIASLMTVGVYGLVGAIVKIDDAGLLLLRRSGAGVLTDAIRGLGRGLLWFAPRLMKTLTVVGTLAMFLVGGGILLHASHAVTELVEAWASGVRMIGWMLPTLIGGFMGLLAGIVLVKTWDVAGPLVARQRSK